MCVLFMFMEIVGGFIANSLAVICDAFHLLSDLAGFIISLIANYLSKKAPTKRWNFGFRRFEVLGAFTSMVFIWLLTGGLLYMAIHRMINASYEINSPLMIIMAGIGVLINAFMAFSLSYSHHKCSHSLLSHAKCQENLKSSQKHHRFHPPKIIDSKFDFHHLTTDKISKKLLEHKSSVLSTSESMKSTNLNVAVNDTEKIDQMVSRNINIRAAFIHIIGDLIQSIGVLIASLIIYFFPTYKIADPICTVLFSVIVIATTMPIMLDIFNVLTESFPKKLDYDDLTKTICSIEGIKSIHDLKVWYLSTDSYAINLRVLIDSKYFNTSQMNVFFLKTLIAECKLCLMNIHDFKHLNIQIDFDD